MKGLVKLIRIKSVAKVDATTNFYMDGVNGSNHS